MADLTSVFVNILEYYTLVHHECSSVEFTIKWNNSPEFAYINLPPRTHNSNGEREKSIWIMLVMEIAMQCNDTHEITHTHAHKDIKYILWIRIFVSIRYNI